MGLDERIEFTRSFDPALYNRALWDGTMGGKPYPIARSGLDLRHDRDVLLKSAGVIRQSAEPPFLEQWR